MLGDSIAGVYDNFVCEHVALYACPRTGAHDQRPNLCGHTVVLTSKCYLRKHSGGDFPEVP